MKMKFTEEVGEGIFFTSRVFDTFMIVSHKLSFVGFGNREGTLWEERDDLPGTGVLMKIKKDSPTQLINILTNTQIQIKTRVSIKLLFRLSLWNMKENFYYQDLRQNV